jgi:orotidine-5'-phosphate decarboxylase
MAWGTPSNFMYVVGATRPDMLAEVRKIVPDHFLLVPGVGAQGGSLEEVCHFGMNDEIGLLVNASRSILYASNGKDFATAASAEAKRLAKQMKTQLKEKGVI